MGLKDSSLEISNLALVQRGTSTTTVWSQLSRRLLCGPREKSSSLFRMVLASSAKRGMSLSCQLVIMLYAHVDGLPPNGVCATRDRYALEGRDDLAVLFSVHAVLQSVGGLYISLPAHQYTAQLSAVCPWHAPPSPHSPSARTHRAYPNLWRRPSQKGVDRHTPTTRVVYSPLILTCFAMWCVVFTTAERRLTAVCIIHGRCKGVKERRCKLGSYGGVWNEGEHASPRVRGYSRLQHVAEQLISP